MNKYTLGLLGCICLFVTGIVIAILANIEILHGKLPVIMFVGSLTLSAVCLGYWETRPMDWRE